MSSWVSVSYNDKGFCLPSLVGMIVVLPVKFCVKIDRTGGLSALTLGILLLICRPHFIQH